MLAAQMAKALGNSVTLSGDELCVDDDEMHECLQLLVPGYDTVFKSKIANDGDNLFYELLVFSYIIQHKHPIPTSRAEMLDFMTGVGSEFSTIEPQVDSVQLFFEWRGDLQKNRTYNVFCCKDDCSGRCCPREYFYKTIINYIALMRKSAAKFGLERWSFTLSNTKAYVSTVKKRQLTNHRDESGSAMWDLQDVEELDAFFEARKGEGSDYDRVRNAQFATIFAMLVHAPQRAADVVKYLNAHVEFAEHRGVEWIRILVPNEKSRQLAVRAAFKQGERLLDVTKWLSTYLSFMSEYGITMQSEASRKVDTSVLLFPEIHDDNGTPLVYFDPQYDAGNIETDMLHWPSVSTGRLNNFLIDAATDHGINPDLRVHGLRGSKAFIAMMQLNDQKAVNDRMGWQPTSDMGRRYARLAQIQAMNAKTETPLEFKEIASFDWSLLNTA
jgi:hypothetical protein